MAGNDDRHQPRHTACSILPRSPFSSARDTPSGASSPSFAPKLSLPTGGGALRSIGETFSANHFCGSGSLAVPIATSPGRSGFGPSLALTYSSGLGNGPWGLGWQLGVPAIARKTDKGVPGYYDDTFILAGADDLVPVLDAEGKIASQLRDEYRVHRFRPRVEAGFAMIERWTLRATGEAHWRTITADNVTHSFGRTAAARVVDPENPKNAFSWLLEESHDDRGNIIVYEYAQEDLAGVFLHAPEEMTRLARTT